MLKRLREWTDTPVLILSVRDDETGKVEALDAGADDYVTKPFSTAELLARLRAAQRKTRAAEEASLFQRGPLRGAPQQRSPLGAPSRGRAAGG